MRGRILLVDNHPVVLAGLQALVLGLPELELVGQVTSASQALALVREQSPNIVTLDIGLPGMNGVALAERILEGAPEIRIVMLTHYEEASYVQKALRTGVRGYVLKASPTEKVVQAIRTVQSGGVYIDSELEEFRSDRMRKLVWEPGQAHAPLPNGKLTGRCSSRNGNLGALFKERASSAASSKRAEVKTNPSSSNVTSPASNAASHRADSRSPLCTSSRCASDVQSDHGIMCEALSSAGLETPLNGQVPFQYSIRASRKMFCPILNF